MPKQTIRTFVAIPLEKNLQEILSNIQRDLKKSGADVKWVRPENIHLTLKFLGDTPVDQIDPIVQILETCATGFQTFDLTLSHIEAFPRLENPRVIWLGSPSIPRQILDFVQDLGSQLEFIGFKKESRAFQMHVTLGRVRTTLNQIFLIKALKEYNLQMPLTQKIKTVHLIQSTLTSQGPIYESLRRVSLGK